MESGASIICYVTTHNNGLVQITATESWVTGQDEKKTGDSHCTSWQAPHLMTPNYPLVWREPSNYLDLHVHRLLKLPLVSLPDKIL